MASSFNRAGIVGHPGHFPQVRCGTPLPAAAFKARHKSMTCPYARDKIMSTAALSSSSLYTAWHAFWFCMRMLAAKHVCLASHTCLGLACRMCILLINFTYCISYLLICHPQCCAAWYKLMTRDMGPFTRCLGPDVPPPQPFQKPLPAPSPGPVNYTAVEIDIRAVLTSAETTGLVATLAYQCASTYRATDKSGGCNGARIRFAPEINWNANKGMGAVLVTLTPIKNKYPSLSWSDLIVLAGVFGLTIPVSCMPVAPAHFYFDNNGSGAASQ